MSCCVAWLGAAWYRRPEMSQCGLAWRVICRISTAFSTTVYLDAKDVRRKRGLLQQRQAIEKRTVSLRKPLHQKMPTEFIAEVSTCLEVGSNVSWDSLARKSCDEVRQTRLRACRVTFDHYCSDSTVVPGGKEPVLSRRTEAKRAVHIVPPTHESPPFAVGCPIPTHTYHDKWRLGKRSKLAPRSIRCT